MKSAIKRIRTSAQANLRNRSRISKLNTLEKKLRAAVAANDAVAVEYAKDFVSALDKAAKVGTIHANRAANKKSQADKLVSSMAK